MIEKIRKFKIQKRLFNLYNKTKLKCRKTKIAKIRRLNIGSQKQTIWNKRKTSYKLKSWNLKDKTNF